MSWFDRTFDAGSRKPSVDRLEVIAHQVNRVSTVIRLTLDAGADLTHQDVLEVLSVLDAIEVYARGDGPEPQSFKAGSLRLVE